MQSPLPTPSDKVFPSNPHLNVEVLSSLSFLKIWLEVQPPAECGVCTLCTSQHLSVLAEL